MTTKALREYDYFVAWLLFTIIATVGGIIAGGIVGTSLGMIFNRVQASDQMILIIGVAAGYSVATTVSYLAFRLVVRHQIVKKLHAHHLAEMSQSPLPPATNHISNWVMI